MIGAAWGVIFGQSVFCGKTVKNHFLSFINQYIHIKL